MLPKLVRSSSETPFTALLPGTNLLAAVVTDSGHEMLEILFVLQTGMIVNIVTDLTLEDFLRRKWLHEKDRIIISHDELECVRIRQSETLGQVQFVAMLMTCTVEPGALVDANCIDDQSVALPLPNRISVPCRIVFRIGRMIAAIGVNQTENMLRLAKDCDDIGTLNNHRWMRSCRHSRRAWWQTLRIRILCMIDVLISLCSVWCQDELFSRQRVFCNVIHRPTK